MEESPAEWVSIFERRLAHVKVPQVDHPAIAEHQIKFVAGGVRESGDFATWTARGMG